MSNNSNIFYSEEKSEADSNNYREHTVKASITEASSKNEDELYLKKRKGNCSEIKNSLEISEISSKSCEIKKKLDLSENCDQSLEREELQEIKSENCSTDSVKKSCKIEQKNMKKVEGKNMENFEGKNMENFEGKKFNDVEAKNQDKKKFNKENVKTEDFTNENQKYLRDSKYIETLKNFKEKYLNILKIPNQILKAILTSKQKSGVGDM